MGYRRCLVAPVAVFGRGEAVVDSEAGLMLVLETGVILMVIAGWRRNVPIGFVLVEGRCILLLGVAMVS